MEIIKTDNSGEVRDQGVSFPSTVSESTTKGSNNISTEDGSETAHESGLSASRIGGDTNHDGGLSLFQGHVETAGRSRPGNILGHESRRGEGGDSGEGGKRETELHVVDPTFRKL